MRIKSLAVEANSKQPVMILTDEAESRFLPIWIGIFEADAILQALEKVKVTRPSTHDLMKIVVGDLGAELERVVIHTLKETTFFATMVFKKSDGSTVEIDARPSDSVALAVRVDAPVFATENVLNEGAVLDKSKVSKQMKDLKDFIGKVKPADFEKYDNALRHGETPPDMPDEDKGKESQDDSEDEGGETKDQD
jgi:bifunctional DNase/RNase